MSEVRISPEAIVWR